MRRTRPKFAFDNYKTTLDEQSKLDALKTDIALAGLSIAGGTFLTASFGTALLSGLGTKLSMTTIYKFELERAFNVAHAVANSPSVKFALTSVVDDVISKQIGDAVKDSIKSETSNEPIYIAAEPDVLKSKMKIFLSKAYERIDDQAVAFWNDQNKGAVRNPMSAKVKFLENLRTTAFFNPPKSALPVETGTVSSPFALPRRMELAWYMSMVADSDYFLEFGRYNTPPALQIDGVLGGAHPEASLGQNLLVEPNDPRYDRVSKSGKGEIMFGEIGVKIADRINSLYKQEKALSGSKDFIEDVNLVFDEPLTQRHIQLAYDTLEAIGPLCRQEVRQLYDLNKLKLDVIAL